MGGAEDEDSGGASAGISGGASVAFDAAFFFGRSGRRPAASSRRTEVETCLGMANLHAGARAEIARDASKFAMAGAAVRDATPADVPAAASIVYTAFRQMADRHAVFNFTSQSLEHATSIVAGCVARRIASLLLRRLATKS